MTGGRQGGGGGGRNKALYPPVNFIFNSLMKKDRIVVWLFEQPHSKIEGTIVGFDEFMNIVLDDAVEVVEKSKLTEESREQIGQIMLKGDNVAVLQLLNP